MGEIWCTGNDGSAVPQLRPHTAMFKRPARRCIDFRWKIIGQKQNVHQTAHVHRVSLASATSLQCSASVWIRNPNSGAWTELSQCAFP